MPYVPQPSTAPRPGGGPQPTYVSTGTPTGGPRPPGAPPGAPPLPPPPEAPNISAERDPRLDAATADYQKWLDSIEGGTGRILDQATSRTRDASEGIRTATREDGAFRGVPTAQAEADLDAQSQRTIAGQHAAIAAEREKMLGQGIQNKYGMEKGTTEVMQGDKALGLSAYNSYQGAMQAYNQANASNSNTLFNQLQSVLQAQLATGASAAAPPAPRPNSLGGVVRPRPRPGLVG